MSIQAVAWVLEHERTTTGAERLVLLALANHAGADGEAWPSVETIMAEANLARRRSVTDALTALARKGLIERVVNGAPDSRIPTDRRPNLYRLAGVSRNVTPLPLRGVESRRNGVSQNGTQTVSEPSTKKASPSSEPLPEQAIAAAEWERRRAANEPLPLGKFVAFRTRIAECLAAGHTPDAIAKALPTMTTFTRGSFEYALSGGHRANGNGHRKRADDRIDRDRGGPSGAIDIRTGRPK
jgi:hypothetical protein